MKALLLVITALFVCVLGYYSSRITIAATVKAGSDTSSRSHGWKQQTEKEGGSHEGSDHHHPTAAFNATTPPLRLWSSDFHISPIADIKDLLGDSAIVVDKSLSGHCHLTDTCERDLRVITKMNGITILSCCASDNLYLQLLLLLLLLLTRRSYCCNYLPNKLQAYSCLPVPTSCADSSTAPTGRIPCCGRWMPSCAHTPPPCASCSCPSGDRSSSSPALGTRSAATTSPAGSGGAGTSSASPPPPSTPWQPTIDTIR